MRETWSLRKGESNAEVISRNHKLQDTQIVLKRWNDLCKSCPRPGTIHVTRARGLERFMFCVRRIREKRIPEPSKKTCPTRPCSSPKTHPSTATNWPKQSQKMTQAEAKTDPGNNQTCPGACVENQGFLPKPNIKRRLE